MFFVCVAQGDKANTLKLQQERERLQKQQLAGTTYVCTRFSYLANNYYLVERQCLYRSCGLNSH